MGSQKGANLDLTITERGSVMTNGLMKIEPENDKKRFTGSFRVFGPHKHSGPNIKFSINALRDATSRERAPLPGKAIKSAARHPSTNTIVVQLLGGCLAYKQGVEPPPIQS